MKRDKYNQANSKMIDSQTYTYEDRKTDRLKKKISLPYDK